MKNIIYTFILLLLALITLKSHAQLSYEARMTNFTQVSEMEFQFDIQIRNNSVNPVANTFAYNDSQFQIDINTALLNGGQFNNALLTVNNAGSNLVANQQLTSGMFFYSAPNTALATGSPTTNNGDLVTIFNDNNWKTITRFSVQIMNAAGTNYNNFADVNPEFAFRLDDCIVYACEYTFNAFPPPGTYTRQGNSILITNKTLTLAVDPDQELAGYYFSNNGEWNTNSNWNNQLLAGHPNRNQPPLVANNALIAASAIIPGTLNVSVKNIYLRASGALTVQSGGSLIHNNTGVLATVQRTLPGSSLAWHTISAPVNGMLITGSGFQPGASDDFYLWHEPSPGTWVNYKNQDGGGGTPSFPVANGGNNFAPGRGYLVAYNEANPTKTFAGGLNAGNVNIALSKSGTKWDYTPGWNLIGNPYASSLNFGALTTAGILAENYAQVYDPTAGGGGGYVQVTTIAPHQGFFVVAANNAVSLALNTTHQVHGGTFLKNEGVTAEDMFALKLSNDQYFDITRIFLNSAASSEYDFYDASKLLSFNTSMPQVYSLVNGQHQLAINSVPSISESLTIPVSILVPSNGIMTISLTDIAGAFEDQTIVIHDKITNTFHNLNDMPVYSFVASTEDSPDRFEITFTTVGIPETSVSSLVNAYAFANMLYVMNYSDKATVQLYGLQGQLILNQQIGQGLSSLPIAVPKGSYIVKMISAGETAAKKVVIN